MHGIENSMTGFKFIDNHFQPICLPIATLGNSTGHAVQFQEVIKRMASSLVSIEELR